LAFPNFCKDREFRKFISLMLTKNPLNRLIKLPLIKDHTWFKSFDWESLINMSLEPAYISKAESPSPNKSAIMPFIKFMEVIEI
jgi:hypothetical protein